MKSNVRHRLLASVAIATIATTLSPTSASAAAKWNWECTTLRCSQFTNAGKYSIGVVYGFADKGIAPACYRKERTHDCKASLLQPGERTYSKWDADAIAVKKGCAAYNRVKHAAGPTEWYWQKLNAFDSDNTHSYFKISSDATIKSSC